MKTGIEANDHPEHLTITEEIRKMMAEAHRLIKRKDVSYAELQILADSVAEIRWLLGEWSDVEIKLTPSKPIGEEIRVLKEQALELEGLVKEIRNCLAREQSPARSESGKL